MFLLLIAMVAGLAAGQELDFNYDNQSAWQFLPDSYCGESRQSPIDIVVDNVQESELLIDLVFTGWNNPVNGAFVNTNHGVQFTPTANSTVARFENHRGIYELLQFHFHWGTEAGAGTEHRINSSQLDSELHFVTRKMGENSSSVAGDALAVVSVLLDIDTSAGVTGIWEQLTPVPTANGAETIVNNLRYSDLLPLENRDYYYYEGSLTTPLCTEIVQWFVLKEPVSIPAAIVEAFREVEGAHGEILTENVRIVQALNGRTVQTPRSGAGSNYKAVSIHVHVCTLIISLFVVVCFV